MGRKTEEDRRTSLSEMGAVLTDLPRVEAIVSTEERESGMWMGGDFGNAAWKEPPFGYAIHVTDEPGKMKRLLEEERDIDASYGRPSPEFNTGGLYVSAVPQLWVGRATGKWGFLEDLNSEERFRLSRKIQSILFEQRSTRYISQSEFENAYDRLRRFEQDPALIYAVLHVAGQPFNIASWKPDFLEEVGIRPGKQPDLVPVVFHGRFARMREYADRATTRTLKRLTDGAFFAGGLVNVAQLVIWHNSAVVAFGEWINPRWYDNADLIRPFPSHWGKLTY